jgi:sulfoxide reductase heme-binding subunit YedZ
MRRPDAVGWSKPLVVLLALLPLVLLVLAALHNTLGPDPVSRLEKHTGIWALRLLLLTLAITPLRRLTGWNWLIRYRRMLGLFAFFYASVHLTVYLVIDLGGFWSQIFTEIAKKPYITVGFAAWMLLIPLALTSTRGMMRRLGRRWGQLHKLVYLIGMLAILHYLWQVKFGQTIAVRQPVVYAAILAVLLLARWRPRRWALAVSARPVPARSPAPAPPP